MRLLLIAVFVAMLPAALAQTTAQPGKLPADYRQSIAKARENEWKGLRAPDGWLSLVALKPLTGGDVTVGSAPGSALRLDRGAAHAFTLHIAGDMVTLTAVDPSVLLGGAHATPGTVLKDSEGPAAALTWDGQYAYVIRRTGQQTYLRVGDHNAPTLVHAHPLNFYPVDPAYRIAARWVPYTPAHELRMPTVLGTVLTVPSPGYAEFMLDGKTIRLDAMGDASSLTFSFRDGTAKTTTYGAGRHVSVEQPSNGLAAPGTVEIDFNLASNWPCAYTPYGTCPLPPVQNRFDAPVPAGEKRYHD